MDYVDRIKALREDNDLKQKDVAVVLNKSQQGYAHLENRKAKFTVEDIIKLSEFFNVTTDYILKGNYTTKEYEPKYIINQNGNGNKNINNINMR